MKYVVGLSAYSKKTKIGEINEKCETHVHYLRHLFTYYILIDVRVKCIGELPPTPMSKATIIIIIVCASNGSHSAQNILFYKHTSTNSSNEHTNREREMEHIETHDGREAKNVETKRRTRQNRHTMVGPKQKYSENEKIKKKKNKNK